MLRAVATPAHVQETVLARPLWYNKQIKIDNKSIFKIKKG